MEKRPFIVQENMISALIRSPQMEQLGLSRLELSELRGILEANDGSWFLPSSQMIELSERDILGRVLLHDCAAALKYTRAKERKKPEKQQEKAASALDALRIRVQKHQSVVASELSPEQEPQPQSQQSPPPAKTPEMPQSLQEENSQRNATLQVLFSSNGVSASLKLYPPQEGGRALTFDELIWLVHQQGVCLGLDERVLERLALVPVYGRSFRIAQGKPPVQGKDGQVNILYEMENAGLGNLQNDTVDYKEMGYAKTVSKGDVLCEIISPTEAIDGYNVRGDVILAAAGKPAVIKLGQNTEFSEDGRLVIATKDGQPMFKDRKIVVNEMLSLGKVDGATGNIHFLGSVTVIGDVSSGFTINAGGDIVVKGFVENADLIAEGNVVLLKGMNGGGLGTIQAGLSVRSKFLEQVTVRAGKNVFGDVVLNCEIDCGGYMVLSGVKGCLSGGRCQVRRELQVDTLGNEAELETRVEVRAENGSLDQIEQKQAQRERINTLNKTVAALFLLLRDGNLDADSRKVGLVRAVFLRQCLEEEIRRLDFESEKIRREIQRASSAGQVIVYKQMYSNVQLSIDGVMERSVAPRGVCAIRCRNGELVYESSLPPRRTEKEE